MRWRGRDFRGPITRSLIDRQAPTLLSATIEADGLDVTFVFSHPMFGWQAGSNGFSVLIDGVPADPPEYASGDGTDTILFQFSDPVNSSQSAQFQFQPAPQQEQPHREQPIISLLFIVYRLFINNSEVSPP